MGGFLVEMASQVFWHEMDPGSNLWWTSGLESLSVTKPRFLTRQMVIEMHTHTVNTNFRLLQLLICKEKYLRWCILMNLYDLFTLVFLPALREKVDLFSLIRVQTIRFSRVKMKQERECMDSLQWTVPRPHLPPGVCGEMLGDIHHSYFCIPLH